VPAPGPDSPTAKALAQQIRAEPPGDAR